MVCRRGSGRVRSKTSPPCHVHARQNMCGGPIFGTPTMHVATRLLLVHTLYVRVARPFLDLFFFMEILAWRHSIWCVFDAVMQMVLMDVEAEMRGGSLLAAAKSQALLDMNGCMFLSRMMGQSTCFTRFRQASASKG